MQQEDVGLRKQSVAFELDDAVRRLENMRTLSGTLPPLPEIIDTRTPLGHRIPGLIQTLGAARELLELTHPGRPGITFEELEACDPKRFETFRKAVLECRRIELEVRLKRAEAALSGSPLLE